MFIKAHRQLSPALDFTRQEYLSIQAGLLSSYIHPEGQGQPLLFIHSINAAASSYEMRPLALHYAGKRPVYVLDLPGYGFSERSRRTYHPALFTHAISDFVDHVIKQPVDAVALSLSCEFLGLAALTRPSMFRSLTFISPTGFSHSPMPGGNQGIYDLLNFPLWSQGLYSALVSRSSLRYFLQMSFSGPVDEGLVDYAYETSHQPGARYAPLSFVSGQLFTSLIRPQVYERLKQPGLILFDEDPNIRFDAIPEHLQRHPNWQAARITGTRGLPHWEKLTETVTQLEAFWEGAALAAAPTTAGARSGTTWSGHDAS